MHLNLLQSDQNSAKISYYDYAKESEVKQNNLNLTELAEAIRQANAFEDKGPSNCEQTCTNGSYCPDSANNEQCEQFALSEQRTVNSANSSFLRNRRTRRTVRIGATCSVEPVEDSRKFISEPINVSISGPHNPDLTLIDFPGVVADPNEREIIINMIKPNINKDTSIILAVSR